MVGPRKRGSSSGCRSGGGDGFADIGHSEGVIGQAESDEWGRELAGGEVVGGGHGEEVDGGEVKELD